MLISDANINDEFFIEKIDASPVEMEVLNTIGIHEKMMIQIVGLGYAKDSLLVKNENGLIIQLDAYIIKKIKGNIDKVKRLVK